MEKYNKFGVGLAVGAISATALSYLTCKYLGCRDKADAVQQEEYKFDDANTRKILVCGSGMMVPGLVSYLMRDKRNRITIASNIIEQAKEIADKYPGRCVHCELDVSNHDVTVELVKGHDIAVSYIPPFLHPHVFEWCLEAGVNLVTASYISDVMRGFHEKAKEKGLIFLNECGLDPGIDIMSTMKVKHEVERQGGKILKYESWCGGLPAAEDADNPLLYKFSWDPKAVFNTSKNTAKFLKNGEIVEIDGSKLLTEGTESKHFVKSLNLEGYPNRDSLSFKNTFEFNDWHSFVRGTLRYGGFGIIMLALHQIGITDSTTEIDHSKIKSMRDLAEFLVKDVPDSSMHMQDTLKHANLNETNQTLASKLLSKVSSTTHLEDIISSWKFFELFNEKKMIDKKAKTILDALSLVSLEKMSYQDGERDLVVMAHIFEIEDADKNIKILHSTMVATGDPQGSEGFSVMAKTVGYTTAIGINLILDGKITETGVISPQSEDVYTQILKILEEDNIKVHEEYQ